MYRIKNGKHEHFLIHPGGPFFKNKDAGSWSIPKGFPEGNETLEETAVREFREETGINPAPPYFALGAVKLKGGKIIHAWAFKTDIEGSPQIESNTFEMEWPPKSGKVSRFPEADKGAFFTFKEALLKINSRQVEFLMELRRKLLE